VSVDILIAYVYFSENLKKKFPSRRKSDPQISEDKVYSFALLRYDLWTDRDFFIMNLRLYITSTIYTN